MTLKQKLCSTGPERKRACKKTKKEDKNRPEKPACLSTQV
jgi:hypothetical protein